MRYVRIHHVASAEAEEAAAWYEKERAGLAQSSSVRSMRPSTCWNRTSFHWFPPLAKPAG